jgi:methylase of polypeptide subunit release factors
VYYRPETAAAVSYLVQCLVAQFGRRNVDIERRTDNRSERRSEIGQNNALKSQVRKDDHQHPELRQRRLRVFDLCSGTGCIPLLFWHEYYRLAPATFPDFEIFGIEAFERPLLLARHNHSLLLRQQIERRTVSKAAYKSLKKIEFIQANVLHSRNTPTSLRGLPSIRDAIAKRLESKGETARENKSSANDIWISNPPYISQESYNTNTEKSVRDFEPRTALVPPLTQDIQNGTPPSSGNDGDRFHQDILEQAAGMGTEIVLLEVDDMDQAIRVAKMAVQQTRWHTLEIWRDEPVGGKLLQYAAIGSKFVRVCGSGEGRSVLVCTKKGSNLIGRYALTRDEVDTEAFERHEATEEISGTQSQ